MTRTVDVKLTGLARGGELVTVVSLSTIRPRCIEYSLASVTVDIDGCQVSCQAQGITETTALASIARWLVKTLGAKSVCVGHQSMHELLEAA